MFYLIIDNFRFLPTLKGEGVDMKLYIVSTDDYGWDEYDSHVVSAKSPKSAKKVIAEDIYVTLQGNPENWKVKLIGTSKSKIERVEHSSFN